MLNDECSARIAQVPDQRSSFEYTKSQEGTGQAHMSVVDLNAHLLSVWLDAAKQNSSNKCESAFANEMAKSVARWVHEIEDGNKDYVKAFCSSKQLSAEAKKLVPDCEIIK